MDYVLLEGDTLQTLKELDDNSVDSIVTDPPYGISFMNKKWDHNVPSVAVFKEMLRVLKPGGHMLCACGTRTQHRMAVNIEDAGFEVRDVITWHYGSGFPKSHDVSKAIDKAAGAEREVVGEYQYPDGSGKREVTVGSNDYVTRGKDLKGGSVNITAPSTPEAQQWEGWGTALKPATEFWTLARKPLEESTVAENVLTYGTGGINIDGCRIEGEKASVPQPSGGTGDIYGFKNGAGRSGEMSDNSKGRFPANLIFDEFTAGLLDEQTGILKSGKVKPEGFKGEFKAQVYGKYAHNTINPETVYGDSGGASRFFYVAKPSKKERNAGLENFALKDPAAVTDFRPTLKTNPENWTNGTDTPFTRVAPRANNHPTVKPIALMRYFVRLITPKGGICLDTYNGSGTTGCACALEDIDYMGIDNEPDYIAMSEARIAYWKKEAEKINKS